MQCMCSHLLVLLLGHHEPQTQRQNNFTYAATSYIIPDIWKTQFLELTALIFLKDYSVPGSALVIFKAYDKAHEKLKRDLIILAQPICPTLIREFWCSRNRRDTISFLTHACTFEHTPYQLMLLFCLVGFFSF